ncbi:MAG: histidine kinase [Gammaproteobacteria bacterium SG8_47]|nr:MAG: histidine kinase [Gammaproteobacteria bacterium SG8_47]
MRLDPKLGVLCARVLENLATVVMLFDKDLRLSYANPAAEMLFEASARHLYGRTLSQLLEHGDGVFEALREAIASGHPFTQREVVLQLNAERQVTVDISVLPLRDTGLERELLVELVPIDRQLRILREESLLAQQQATRDLLRGMAHEVKNPLGGLRGAAQLLQRELHDPELVEYTKVIIEEADRLQNLVDRMLGPKRLPQLESVNIHELIERVRSLVQAELPDNIRLLRDYDPSIPDLIVDRDQLIQALLNILRNAVQALTDGGTVTLRTRVHRKFTIGPQRYDLVANVQVIDDGPGIAAEVRETLFYPMVTGRPEGTGLGLTIAQSLIQQHGGLIECESRPGRTVFSILIPVKSST